MLKSSGRAVCSRMSQPSRSTVITKLSNSKSSPHQRGNRHFLEVDRRARMGLKADIAVVWTTPSIGIDGTCVLRGDWLSLREIRHFLAVQIHDGCRPTHGYLNQVPFCKYSYLTR